LFNDNIPSSLNNTVPNPSITTSSPLPFSSVVKKLEGAHDVETCDGDGVGEGEGEGEGDGEGEGVGDGVGEGVGDGDGDGVGELTGDGVGVVTGTCEQLSVTPYFPSDSTEDDNEFGKFIPFVSTISFLSFTKYILPHSNLSRFVSAFFGSYLRKPVSPKVDMDSIPDNTELSKFSNSISSQLGT